MRFDHTLETAAVAAASGAIGGALASPLCRGSDAFECAKRGALTSALFFGPLSLSNQPCDHPLPLVINLDKAGRMVLCTVAGAWMGFSGAIAANA